MNSITLHSQCGNHFLRSGEPVFVLRGQDELAVSAVLYWVAVAESRGLGQEMLQSARAHAMRMAEWPVKKLPDMKVPVEVGAKFTFNGLNSMFKPFSVSGSVESIDLTRGTLGLDVDGSDEVVAMKIDTFTEMVEAGQVKLRRDGP